MVPDKSLKAVVGVYDISFAQKYAKITPKRGIKKEL